MVKYSVYRGPVSVIAGTKTHIVELEIKETTHPSNAIETCNELAEKTNQSSKTRIWGFFIRSYCTIKSQLRELFL